MEFEVVINTRYIFYSMHYQEKEILNCESHVVDF